MPRRVVEGSGERWTVSAAGRITQYDKDEFALRFSRLPAGSGPERSARYSPVLAQNIDTSLAPLTQAPPPRRLRPSRAEARAASPPQPPEAELLALFRVSQPSWTSPELGYRR